MKKIKFYYVEQLVFNNQLEVYESWTLQHLIPDYKLCLKVYKNEIKTIDLESSPYIVSLKMYLLDPVEYESTEFQNYEDFEYSKEYKNARYKELEKQLKN